MLYRTFLIPAAIAAALPVGLSTLVSADVVTSYYVSGSNYEFELEHMPDFDQVRDDLGVDDDGDPGGMYCVPTSLTNLLGYISTHGFPSVGLTAADWEAEEDYEFVTGYINNLALLAGTNPTTGTNMQDAYEAMAYFLECRAPGVFNVTHNIATNTTGPTLRSIVDNDVNGAISVFCHGRYECIGTDAWDREVLDRDGGHCVTFVRGYRNGSTREIAYREPDDSSNSSAQSNFDSSEYDVESITFVKAESTFAASFMGQRTGSRIMRGSSDSYRVIDKVIHVKPRACYSWETSVNGWSVIWPTGFESWDLVPVVVPGPPAEALVDFTLGPSATSIWYLDSAAPTTAFAAHMSNHQVKQFDLPHPGRKLAFGRDHALVVLGDGQLSRLHPFAEDGENAPEPRTIQIPGQPEYFAIDDSTDTIWLAGLESSNGTDHVVWGSTLVMDMEPVQYAMPEDWPGNIAIAGLATTDDPEMPLAILGVDGRVHLCEAGDNGLLVTRNQIWTDGTMTNIQFNDEGDLLAFGQGGLRMFRKNLQGWVLVDDHPFSQQAISPRSLMARNRSNYDPAIHSGDEWRQVRDQETVAGDLNDDGVVGIDDLLALLALFGEEDNSGDLDDDGQVGINDLLLLLASWSP